MERHSVTPRPWELLPITTMSSHVYIFVVLNSRQQRLLGLCLISSCWVFTAHLCPPYLAATLLMPPSPTHTQQQP